MVVGEELIGWNIGIATNRSQLAGHGKGSSLTAVQSARPIMAGQSIKTGLKGGTVFAAPIRALAGTPYQVKGTLGFIPQENASHVVRGKFGNTYSAAWVGDVASKALVGRKVELNGSAELGLLEQ